MCSSDGASNITHTQANSVEHESRWDSLSHWLQLGEENPEQLLCRQTDTHTHTYTGLQVNHNVLIRLGVFVVAQNTTGANKAVQRLFIVLHLGMYVCVFTYVCVMAHVQSVFIFFSEAILYACKCAFVQVYMWMCLLFCVCIFIFPCLCLTHVLCVQWENWTYIFEIAKLIWQLCHYIKGIYCCAHDVVLFDPYLSNSSVHSNYIVWTKK